MADDMPDYGAILRDQNQQALRTALVKAAGVNPDEEARRQRLARLYGVPYSAAETQDPALRAQAQADVADTLLGTRTGAFLSDPRNANVAHDDIDVLDHIEQTLKNLGGIAKGSGLGVLSSFYGGVQALNEFIDPLGDLGFAQRRTLDLKTRLFSTAGPEPYAQRTARETGAAAKAAMPTTENWMQAGVNAGVASLLQNMPAMAVGLATRNPELALGLMGAQTAGGAYTDARVAGADPAKAALHAVEQGGVEVMTEKLPMETLLGDLKAGSGIAKTWLHQLATDLPGELMATTVQNFNEWVNLHPDKSLMDYLTSLPGDLGATVIATAMGASGHTAMQQTVRAIGAVAEHEQRKAQAAQAQAAGDVLKGMAKIGEASKLQARSPEQFREFIDTAARETPAESVWIEPAAVAKAGVDVAALAQEMPSLGPQLAEALATGGQARVPLGEFMAASPQAQADVLDHLKLTPEGMSRAEAEEFMQTEGEKLREEVARVMAKAHTDDAFEASLGTVRDALAAQYNALGAATGDVQAAHLEPLVAFYATTAQRLGITPEALYQQYPLQITGGEAIQSAGMMDQFAGARSATADLGRLHVAQQAAAAGADLNRIRELTGWFQGHDGKWRYEISDREMQARPDAREKMAAVHMAGGRDITLGDMIEHDKLFAAYPDLATLPARIVSGEMNGIRFTGAIARNKDTGKPTLLIAEKLFEPGHERELKRAIMHEVQHLVQRREGFAIGATTDYDALAASDYSGALQAEFERLGDKDAAALEVYRRSAGELEARDTEARVEHNEAGRRGWKPQAMRQPEGAIVAFQMEGAPEFSLPADEVFGAPRANEPQFDLSDPAKGGNTRRAREITVGDTTLSYTWHDGHGAEAPYVTVDMLHTERKGRGLGAGRRLMEALAAQADRAGVRLALTAEPMDKGITKAKLERFYKSLGFKRNTDPFVSAAMLREPRVLEQAGDPLFHGSRQAGITTLQPSERGALGPGVYLTPNSSVAGRYGDNVYEAVEPEGVFQGLGSRDSRVNPYQVWRDQLARLVAAAGDKGAEVQAIGEKMQPADGYPFYKRLVNLLGGDAQAQQLFRDAGFTGLSGYVDGPEVVIFDPLAIAALQQEGAPDGWGAAEPGVAVSRGPLGTFNPNTLTIRLSKNANLSTFLHETGHFYLHVLSLIATMPNAPQQIRDDMDTLLRWWGTPGETPEARLEAWHGMTLDQQRPGHETFARGFELYLMEGKAPARGLRGVFRRFKAWMTRLYGQAVNLRSQMVADMSDDVRQVMDRLLATDEQIAEAAMPLGLPLIATPEEARALGMSDEEWQAYQGLAAQATAEAVDKLQARSIRDMKWLSNAKDRVLRRLQAEAREARKAVRAEVTSEVLATPVYRAMQYLKRGVLDGEAVEGARKLNLEAVKALFKDTPAELADWQRLGYGKYGMLAENGENPDVIAEAMGFPSGEALIEALLNAEPMDEVIAGLTDQRMLERHGDLTDEQAMREAADEELHNDARLRAVATEANALAKATGGRKILADAAREFAARMIGRQRIKDVKPYRWRNAEVRAARAAERLHAAGKLVEASVEKRNQLINGYATRAAYDAQAELRKAETFFKRIAAGNDEVLSRSRNMDLVNAARAILALHGYGAPRKNPIDYMLQVQRYDPQLFADLEPYLNDAAANRKPIDELTFDEFTALRDTVNQLWFMSRRSKQIEIDGKLMDRAQAVAELNARLDAQGATPVLPGATEAVTAAEKLMFKAASLRAGIRRVESWVTAMDGGAKGPFRRYIWTRISEAADRYRLERRDYLARFRALLAPIEASLKPFRIAAPEIGYTFSGKAELLHALLHTGNPSNKEKLLAGRAWATARPDGTLDDSKWQAFVDRMHAEGKITKADWDFVQGVWDLLDDTKVGAQRAHHQVYGRYFAEVTAAPVQTPFGEYRGGYVPAIADAEIVQDAAIRAQEAAAEGVSSLMFPQASKGFTQARVKYNRPLALDLGLIPAHISTVLKFTHFEPVVRDTARLVKEQSFARRLQSVDPMAMPEMLLPWLNRAARQQSSRPGEGVFGRTLDTVWTKIRSRAGLGIMALNLSNTVQQVVGLSAAATRVKPSHLAGGLWTLLTDREAVQRIHALSPFMEGRADNQIQFLMGEIDKLVTNPSPLQRAQDWSMRHGYALQAMAQNAIDNSIWLGAYDQAIARGDDNLEAARFANSVVRETQGSLSPEDMARFEAGTPFARLFTQFSAYFNSQLNMLGTDFKIALRDMGLKGGAQRAAYVYLMGLMIPAVLSEIIAQAFRGALGHDDDDDGYLDDLFAMFFGSQLRYSLAMAPGAGALATAALNATNDKPYDDRIATAPALASVEAASVGLAGDLKAWAEGKGKAGKTTRDALTAVTLAFGVPVQALGRPASYLADVAQGRVTPTGPLDAVRGAITGTASPDSRNR